MPYIKQSQRNDVESYGPSSIGELNYKLTKHIQDYIWNNSLPEHYETYNSIIGVLECCKLELYRRIVAPYEDKKIEENGDVY